MAEHRVLGLQNPNGDGDERESHGYQGRRLTVACSMAWVSRVEAARRGRSGRSKEGPRLCSDKSGSRASSCSCDKV